MRGKSSEKTALAGKAKALTLPPATHTLYLCQITAKLDDGK